MTPRITANPLRPTPKLVLTMMYRCRGCGHVKGAHSDGPADRPSTGSGPCVAGDCEAFRP